MRESRERDGEIVVNWPASNVRATQPQRPPPPPFSFYHQHHNCSSE
jgi:hypothetical protein